MDIANTYEITNGSNSSINISLKQISQKGSLANLLRQSQGTILEQPEADDALSICDHL